MYMAFVVASEYHVSESKLFRVTTNSNPPSDL